MPTYLEDPDNPKWRRADWEVRAKKTGVQVGTLCLRIDPDQTMLNVHHFKLTSLRDPTPPINTTPFTVQHISAAIDWDKGIIWVEHASDLHGFYGFEWL